MKQILVKKWKGFRYAFRGIGLMLRDYNTAIHLPAALAVLGLAWFFQVTKNEWLWLLLAISLMWILETVNTSIERLTDLASPQQHPLAGAAKDLAAAAVLLGLCFAAVVGAVIFLPYIFAWWYQ